MNKKYKSRKSKFRNIAFGITTVALSCIIGMTAACDTDDDDDETEKVTTKQDTQVLKNGNFEFYDDNDGLYYISSPDNWSGSSNGSSSDSMSGVIKTDYTSWASFTDETLPDTLSTNDDLDDDDDDKVDYNGVLQDDLPYADTHRATKSDAEKDNGDLEYIANPYTHSYKWDDDGNLIDNDGNTVKTYTDDDGKYYFDEDLTNPVETSVLMIHNYDEDNNYGTEYYYTSSTTLTLEANTAAKISVWVKTVNLYFAGSTGDRTKVSDSMGAYIKVAQTVGGTSLDSFYIKNIDTENFTDSSTDNNNGWVQYNIYVQACDYAETTLTLTLGLGENSRYLVEGYAFFDDVTYTKYMNADDMKADNGGEELFDKLVKDTTCDLGSSEDEKKFRTDKVVIKTEKDDRELNYYNGKYDFYINLNLADAANTNDFVFDKSSVQMGLTVDSNNYISSKETPSIINASQIEDKIAYVPKDLPTTGKNTKDDVLANVTITNAGILQVDGKNVFGEYQDIISKAINSAVDLPGATSSQSTLVMLSTEGAAYQSNISNSNLFTLSTKDGNDSYKVVSFWVKTSDMKGDTAATITVRDKNDTSNSSSFTIDSTTVSQTDITATDITAEDATTQTKHTNVYDGWVQCFVLVSNTLEDNESEFEILVNFGTTTIKDTTSSSYRAGWVAVSNMTVIEVDDTAYGYISSSNSATLSFSESTTSTSTVFDTEFGDNGEIDNQIVRPANYNGYNGTSAIVTVGGQTNEEINQKNKNVYAGLINKDGILNYNLGDTLNALMQQYKDADDADGAWKFLTQGSNASINHTVQPLLIVNTLRTIAEETKYYSYGYVGSSSSISTSSYEAVSVKVYASEGAIARVYLIDPDTKKTLNFDFPTYTFWYDDDGNVLKNEPEEDADTATQKANIAYTLESNGLYTRDGLYYANIYNLKKEYFNEKATYYDAEGNAFIYEDLKDGVEYYSDATGTKYAPHYLVTDDGDRVYYYIEGLTSSATYNYLVEDAVDTDIVVHGFDTTVATPRYVGADQSVDTDYMFTIDTVANPELANKWITVNFYVYTGNQEKNYRLELWSGARDSLEIVDANGNAPTKDSYVLFDYSYTSLDEDAFNNLRDYYTDAIIADYRATLSSANADTEFNSNEENLTYYEQLAGEGNKSSKYNYDAKYYTYTLYDSTNYQPFNEDTAEDDETGYVYTYSDFDESLAFLKIDDTSSKVSPSMTMFIDYSTASQEITVGTASDVEDDDDDEDTTSNTNVWLLASSIALVVALLVAIFAILIKDLVKKLNRRKTAGKNSYNYNKNKRYVKKYTKANGDILADGTTKGKKSAKAATSAENAQEASNDVTPDNTTATETTPATATETTPATAPETSPEAETTSTESSSEATPAEEVKSDDKSENKSDDNGNN